MTSIVLDQNVNAETHLKNSINKDEKNFINGHKTIGWQIKLPHSCFLAYR